MRRYVLENHDTGERMSFEAKDDAAAEAIVEQSYDEDDGKMTLYCLIPVCEWP